MSIWRGINRTPNLGVVLLAGNIMNFGLNNVPPATLALIASQAAIFMNMLPNFFPSPNRVCISSYLVFYHRDFLRMLLSAFYHGSDMHLYYNMLSLLYKGSWLEKKLGTVYFVYLISVFTALTSAVYVGLGLLFTFVLNNNKYIMDCAVGFSGVLFALKVLTAHYTPSGPQYVLGFIPVPSKHIYWTELVLIQLLVPNASFVGHLAGILVGIAYIWGPLKVIMDAFLQPEAHTRGSHDSGRTSRTSYFSSRGRATPSARSHYSFDESASQTSYGTDTHSRSHYSNTDRSPDPQEMRSRRAQYYQ